MAPRFQITVTLPRSQEKTYLGHLYNEKGKIWSYGDIATYFLKDVRGGVKAARRELTIQEDRLITSGVKEFSLQATPFRER